MRTREPPAIFQPTAMMIYNPLKALQQKFINMAYKHPQLLIGDEKDESTTRTTGCDDSETQSVMKTDENYGNVNQSDECEERSTIKINIFNGSSNSNSGSSQLMSERSGVLNTNCHLIGNVKPNLIKTWERLNGMPPTQTTQSSTYQNGSSDHPLSQQHHQRDTYINSSIHSNTKYHVFSNQPMANLPPNNNDESFVIRRPPSKSGYFYDSIEVETQDDDDDDDEVDEQEVIASLCDELEHGGEGMAEYISLIEKKEKHCWSIDSSN